MPLDAIFLWVFAVVPSLLIIRFLYWVIPLWLPSALSVGLVWAAVEVYSKIKSSCDAGAPRDFLLLDVLKADEYSCNGFPGISFQVKN